jgi:hypothetical protein
MYDHSFYNKIQRRFDLLLSDGNLFSQKYYSNVPSIKENVSETYTIGRWHLSQSSN